MPRTIDIGALAQGVAARSLRLPFDDYPDGVKRVICNALRVAWSKLCALVARNKQDISVLDEDSITILYKEILNRLLLDGEPVVPGFTPNMFQTVVRDATVVSFDGKHVEKKPDLVFRTIPTSPAEPRHEYRALFVECKIVSQNKPIDLYVNSGMIRFISGEYGWAMRSGMMLCYALDGETLRGCLIPNLQTRRGIKGDPLLLSALPTRVASLGKKPPAYVSRHRRVWTYPAGGRPGELSLTHLWLIAERRRRKRRKKP